MLPNRKTIRLKKYDYNTPGYYFITVCTKDKRKTLCEIKGDNSFNGPQIVYTAYGKAVLDRFLIMRDFYNDIRIERYVVMPNHIHMIVRLLEGSPERDVLRTVRRTVPTNSRIGRFVGTFKRLCNRECGIDLWQKRSHDHIIRGEADYLKIAEYIENNPARWIEDCFYVE